MKDLPDFIVSIEMSRIHLLEKVYWILEALFGFSLGDRLVIIYSES